MPIFHVQSTISGIEERYLARLITLRWPFDSVPRNNSASDMPSLDADKVV